MKTGIPLRDFVRAFRLDDRNQYDMFIEKLSDEMADKLHPSAVVDDLDFISTWKDAGGNTHATLKRLAVPLAFGRSLAVNLSGSRI